MTGQVSSGKEYWSVIGPRRVTTEMWGPALVQGGLFHSLLNDFSNSSLKPPFLSIKNYNILRINLMSRCFSVFKDCRVCLVLLEVGASVLIETDFQRLFSLSNVDQIHWLSSNLSLFASLNNKAFGNLFCNPQKSFHTSPESSDSNNSGCQPFFKLNNSIY